MEKVVYSLTRERGSQKTTGCGFIKEDTLYLKLKTNPDGSKKWFVIDEFRKHLFPAIGKNGEYKGWYTTYSQDAFVPSKNGSYDTRDTETNYFVWFKVLA